jgi:CubicO group peptidase (beta-lactamase class C family)
VKPTIRTVTSLFVTAMILCVFAAPTYAAETTPSGIPLSELGSRIDALVASDMDVSTPGCAIVVSKDGEIVFSKGYGFADVEKKTPIDPASTIFEYGSVSKTFVYVSVMQLVEQGMLDLDANIAIYLPDEVNSAFDFAYPITLRDLINHSAGFGENMFNSCSDAQTTTRESTLHDALIATQPAQVYRPGTASSYSNFGNALAAYIVSQVSGQDYAAYEKQHILEPLGMEHTKNQPDWFGDDAFFATKARGYALNTAGGFVDVPWWYISIYPAGALNGTAEDLARFAQALTQPPHEAGPLFETRRTLDEMLSPSFDDPDVMRGTYHGFFTYDGAEQTLGHAGQTGGFNTDLEIVPSQRFDVVILSNANLGMVFNNKVLDLVMGNSIDLLPDPSPDFPDAHDVAGSYLSLRRHSGNPLALANALLAGVTVEAIDENTIELTMMELTQQYRQVAPYVYRATTPDTLARFAYELTFRMEGDRPIALTVNSPFDATPATWSQGMPALLGGVILAVASIVFFLVASVVLLFKLVRNRGKKRSPFVRISNALVFSGLGLAISFILYLLTMLENFSETGPFIQTAGTAAFVWINYLLLAIVIGLLIASACFMRKEPVEKKRMLLYLVTVVLLAAFTALLASWSFFTFLV